MNVVTLAQAEDAIRTTAIYIQQEFGKRSIDNFLRKIAETKSLLSSNPYLGPLEPLLSDRPSAYRSVVVAKQNKLVYRIINNRFEIADLWDCRREPKALLGEIDSKL